MIVDLNPATEPAEAGVVGAQPSYRPSTADALNSGIQPQGYQQLGIDCGPSGPAFHRSNGLEQRCQVKPLDELPDRAGEVFGGHQVLQKHGWQQGLPVGTAQPRLGPGRSKGRWGVVR